jgi:hypothetical protein
VNTKQMHHLARLRSQQAVAKLASAQPPLKRPSSDYIGEDGISAREVAETLREFGERLHTYALTDDAQLDYERGWNRIWESGMYARQSKPTKPVENNTSPLQGALWEIAS